MNRTHDLKCWPQYFQSVKSGVKPFEVRFNDRDYQVGDTLVLHEWNPETREYSGDFIDRLVTYVMPGGNFGIDPNFVIMGVRAIAAEVTQEAKQEPCQNCGGKGGWEYRGDGYCEGVECLICNGTGKVAAPVPCAKEDPIATIHDDGYWTHPKGRDPLDQFSGKTKLDLYLHPATCERTGSDPATCQESDGCPTEGAVLKREWRRLTAKLAEAERQRDNEKRSAQVFYEALENARWQHSLGEELLKQCEEALAEITCHSVCCDARHVASAALAALKERTGNVPS